VRLGFLLWLYSDLLQTALKYLKDTEANIKNVLIMALLKMSTNLWYLVSIADKSIVSLIVLAGLPAQFVEQSIC